MIFVTVVAIGMAWVGSERSQSQRELQVAHELTKGGAAVWFAGRFDIPSKNAFDSSNEQSWWRSALGAMLGQRVDRVFTTQALTDLSPFAALKRVRVLHLSSCRAHNLSPLVGLNNLHELWIEGNQVTNLSPLSGLKNLEKLFLEDTHVDDLAPLAGLKRIRWLSIHRNAKSIDVLQLTSLDNLRTLDITGTEVHHLSSFSHAKHLEDLCLEAAHVTDISGLAELENLQSLILSENARLADITALAGLKRLAILDVAGTQVRDLSALAGLTNLRTLYLERTPINDEQIQSLKRALPNCAISRQARRPMRTQDRQASPN
jgi:Leucine-rich repeat (LRR) protein